MFLLSELIDKLGAYVIRVDSTARKGMAVGRTTERAYDGFDESHELERLHQGDPHRYYAELIGLRFRLPRYGVQSAFKAL